MKAECDQGKHCYETEKQAYRAAQKSGARDVVAYRHGDHFHITRSIPKLHKKISLPKEHGPKPYQPSLRKLRRWLENQSRVIAAQTRRLDAAEAKQAAEQARAAAAKQKSEQAHREELEHIRKMTERLTWR
jgi:hypothetical protein